MTFISYGQNFEDVILWRALKHIENGYFIDLGAAWPEEHSVTCAFYERGWSGINVEPNPQFWRLLQQERQRDRNLQIAIGDHTGTASLSVISGTGLSTLDSGIAGRHAEVGWQSEQVEVPVTTLAELWANEVPPGQEVHFLKIDVEGSEEATLRSNDWIKNRPWIVVVEATLPLSQEASHESWEPILLGNRYAFAYADGLNRFYVAQEHADLLPAFTYPPNVFDDFETIALHQALLRAAEAESQLSEAKNNVLEQSWRAVKAETRVYYLEHQVATLDRRATTTDELRSELNKAQQELSRIYASLSWKMTSVLRRLNPRYVYRDAWTSVLRRIENLSPDNPVKKYISFLLPARHHGSAEDDFIKLRFGEFLLHFAKAPLADSRGIGRVSRELLASLQRIADFEDEGVSARASTEIVFYSSIHWCPPDPNAQTVAMIHDVTPLILRDIFPPSAVGNWLAQHAPAARRLAHIVTISESSADDIARMLDIPRQRISVVPNGVSMLPVTTVADTTLPVRPFLVYLGADDRHKNLAVVLQALLEPSIAGIDLVMIGENRTEALSAQVKGLGLETRVHFLGRLDDGEVGYVIQHALALVFPSLYEGFGLPPLEAALLGTPSICSRRPAMTELLAGAALFAEPDSPQEWAIQIGHLMRNSAERDGLADRAQGIAEQFTWQRSAESLVSLLREIALRPLSDGSAGDLSRTGG